MTDSDIEQLIGPYLAGELDSAAADRVRAYLQATPGRQGIMAGVRTALRSEHVGGMPAVALSEAALLAKLDAHERTAGLVLPKRGTLSPLRQSPTPRQGEATRRWLVASASAVSILAVIAVLVRTGISRDPGITRTYATAAKQTATVQLPDGTRITMAPQTSVRLVRFGQRDRRVELDGEAYFEVTQSGREPFTVSSGGVLTRVLGTAFVVRHYGDELRVRVAVTDGKVAVRSQTPEHRNVTVVAGHVAVMTDSTTIVRAIDSTNSETAWLRDELIFRDAPMTEVLATLRRWYGYEFRYTDSTLTRQIVTIGLSTQSRAEALSTLTRILNVNLTVVGDTITFTSKTPSTQQMRKYKQRYDTWTPTREVGR